MTDTDSKQFDPPNQCPKCGSPFVHIMGAIAEYACGYWLDRHGNAFKRPQACMAFQIEDLCCAMAWMICEHNACQGNPCSKDSLECESVKEEIASRIEQARRHRLDG